MRNNALSVHQSSDYEIMQAIANNRDQGALSILYERYGTLVYSLSLRVLQHSGLAEEVTQDVFMEVWRHPQSWNPAKGRLSSWMLTIARYSAIDQLRKDSRLPDSNSRDIDTTPSLFSDADNVGDPLWQDGQQLRTLIKRLPPEQAEVIELAFWQGFTHTELAETLNLPLGTIKTRVRLGLQKLRSLWNEGTTPADQ
jgi:RNA polymerase sigma-70 factor (ECF subfamily)